MVRFPNVGGKDISTNEVF